MKCAKIVQPHDRITEVVLVIIMENVYRTSEEPLPVIRTDEEPVDTEATEEDKQKRRKDAKKAFRHAISELEVGFDR